MIFPSSRNWGLNVSLICRALNVLTVKIVDRSDHNNISQALIKLLHECVGNSVLSDKYVFIIIITIIMYIIVGIVSSS